MDEPYFTKDITGFSILGIPGSIGANSISLTVPFGTDRTNLTPTITITGASVGPASGTARDFTNPVSYTVTAADGSTKTYTANVNVASNTAKDITGFTILGVSGSIGANSISLTVPFGTDRTNLTPTITITGASVNPASGVARNFTNPVSYTVTAADGSTKTYTANVNVAPNTAKDITGFSILGIPGSIGANTISLTVPYGTDRTDLTPAIDITGESISPASGVEQNFTNPVVYIVTAADGSTKTYTATVTAALNSAKDITGFTILGVSGSIGANSISLTVPYGTDRTNLTPAIDITGESVSPASGVTRDFTNPVSYTVTAADGTTKTYTVTVTAALNSAKDITGFTILGVSGTIGANSISLTVPYGTDRTNLTPTIDITGASVSPASGVARDFTNAVTYTVTAADGTTKIYTVTVTAALNSAKDITDFTILGVSGTIGANSISLTVPYGTDRTNLTPTIDITGESVSPASGAARDFTDPVTYTVTAADSSTKTYTVNVNVAPNTAKDITGFTILGVSGSIGANSISLTVPYGTNLSSLTPTIDITGESVSPASGVTRDFTNPVSYTVTAADGTTKTYTATVTAALNSAKDITGFTILGVSGSIGANSISLTVPYGNSLSSLTPTITITGASVSPASGVAQNFTNPVTYTVTADDGTTKTYTVTVTAALNSAKDITGFTILGIAGNIEANSISLTVPYGTNLSSLTPAIDITGESVSPASGVTRDFTNPVSYTVTAADGTTKTYTVTVTAAEAGTIYWTEVGGAIKNIHNDGTGEVTLLTVTGTPLDIALDISDSKIYWTEYTVTAYQIRRAGMDGSNPAVFAEYSTSGGNRFGPTAIAIDSGTSRIYWNYSQVTAGQEYLYYSSLNSFSAVQWTSSVPYSYVHSLCIDTTRRGFYFNANTYWNIGSTFGSGRSGVACYSSNIDNINSHSTPINETDSSTSSTRLRGIAVGGDYIYYVYNNSGGLRIVRARYDFQQTIDPWITANGFGIQKIALDLTNNKIYWTSDTNNSIYSADLGTANSNIVQFKQLSNKPTSIAIAQ